MKKDDNARNDTLSILKTTDFLRNIIEILGEMQALIVAADVNIDIAIDESLSKIGQFISASRVYVMQDEKEGNYLRNTHEWVNGDIGPAMFSWPLYDYKYDLPSLKGIMEEQSVFFGHTKDLPQDINNVLSKQGVKTVMLTPLFRDGKRTGIVGCDFCEAEFLHCDECADLLLYFSGLVSIALERKQYQLIRRKFNTICLAVADIKPVLMEQEMEEPPANRNTKPISLQDAERRIIIETLELYNGNKLKTAKHLGLTWPSLDRRCKKMGIEIRKR